MNTTFTPFAEQFQSFLAPLTKANQFVVEQIEKLAALQLGSLKVYADLGLSQIKVALKVTDPHSVHEFLDSQFAVLSFVGHRVLDDGRALAEWSTGCVTGAERLARENTIKMIFKY